MADISLKAYHDKLNSLLESGSTDELIHHCRHILQYYPRNADTYRFLGRGLLEGSHYREAGDIFRRVLGVYPADYIAHLGLTDVYQRTNDLDAAIWHLERAYEQDPNNDAIMRELRDLYLRHRGEDLTRLQLTAGAVAHQYRRSQLYDQAIDTLHQSLRQNPQRADLRLLLAQTLRESGHPIEAAETALDILKTHPNCLEANRILTELWLEQGRPSDAQTHLSRIEAVAPYVALEIVKKHPPEDDAFTLPELDYQDILQRNLTTQSPDWLEDIDNEDSGPPPADDWMGAVGAIGAAAVVGTAAESVDTDDETDMPLTTEVPADWLADDDDDDLFAGLESDFDAETQTQPPTPIGAGSGLTGLLSALDEDEDDDIPEPETETAAEDIGDMSWLELEEDESLPTASDDDDPMAWLQSEDADLLNDDQPVAQDTTTAREDKETDPMAWLQDSGIEIVEDDGLPAPEFIDDDGEMVYQDQDEIDPMAWLHTSGIELVEDEAEIAGERDLPLADAVDDADPMAWLQDEGVEITDEATPSPMMSASSEDVASHPLDEQVTETGDDVPTTSDLDWLQDDSALAEALDMEALTDTGSLPSSELPPAQYLGKTELFPGNNLDEQVEIGTDGQDAMADNTNNPTPGWSTEPEDQGDSGLDWLNEETGADDAPDFNEQADLDQPIQPETESMSQPATSEQNDYDWLTIEDDEPESEPIMGETPEWLTEDDEASATDEEAPVVPGWTAEASDEPAFDQQPDAEAEFDWLASDDDQPEEEEAVSDDTPDWLTGAGVAAAGAAMGAALLGDDDETDEPEEVVASEDAPDWLAAAAPIAEDEPELAFDQQPDAEAEFDWLASDDDQPEEEEAVSEDAPDWLAAAAPIAEDEPEPAFDQQPDAEAEFDWLASDDDQPEEEEEAVSEDTPDWLTGAGVAAAGAAMGAALLGDDDETDEPEEAVTSEDTPDWLAAAAPIAEDEPEPAFDQQPDAEAEFDWLASDDDQPEPEDEAVISEDAPDWLAAAAPIAEDEPEPAFDQQLDAEAEFDWLASDDDQPEPEEEAVTSEDAPDWLAAAAPIAEDEPEPAFDQQPDAEAEFDWLASDDDQPEPEDEAVISEDAPDWLAAAAPIAEDEPEPEEEEAISEDTPDWLVGAGVAAAGAAMGAALLGDDDETDEPEEVVASEDTPDWLAAAAPIAEDEPEPAFDQQPDAEAEFDWLASDDDQPEPEEEAVISEDAPDWLAAAAPITEDEPEPAFDQQPDAEAEFDWLASDDDQPEPEEEAVSDDTPDWLVGAGVAAAGAAMGAALLGDDDETDEPEPAFDQPEEEAVSDDTPDWLAAAVPIESEPEIFESGPAIAATEATDEDWLTSEDEVPDEGETLPYDAEAVSARDDYDWEESQPEWLETMQDEPEGIVEADLETPETQSEFGWLEGDIAEPDLMPVSEQSPDEEMTASEADFSSDLEKEEATASAPPPADNAPDWLNAMVPGLDLDYEATEEEPPIEREYVEPAASQPTPAATPNPDWLVQVVNEETGPYVPVTEPERKPRFSFTRQPAWLRRPTESAEPKQQDQQDQDDDFELPDWLQ